MDAADPWTQAFCGANETFWNSSITKKPQVSFCFQDTVLVWFPCLLLWICLPIYHVLLLTQTNQNNAITCPRSWLNITKLVFGVLLSLLEIANIVVVVVEANHDSGEFRSSLQASIIRLLTMVLMTLVMAWEFRKAVYNSGFCFVFWLIYAICYSVMVYAFATSPAGTLGKFYELYCKVRLASYSLILLQLILSFLRDGKLLEVLELGDSRPNSGEREPLLIHEHQNQSPRLSANFCSKLFFTWTVPLMFRGYTRSIKYEELSDVWPNELSYNLLPRLQSRLDKDKSDRSNSSKYMRNLLKSVACLVIKAGLLRLFTILLLFVNLLIFRSLIAFIKVHSPSSWLGYLMACGLLVVTGVRGLAVVRWLYDCDLVGMQLRSLITATVYRKILRLSNSCVAENMDIGFVVNLMSIDSLSLSMSCRSLHEVLTLPIYLALATYFFYTTVHWAALVGMVIMITLVPLVTLIVAYKNKKLQDEQMASKDQRLKVMSEILAGIKVIKLYAWELVFEKKANDIRSEELRSIMKASFLNAFGNILCLIMPYIVSLVMFGYYVYNAPGDAEKPIQLDAESAFVSLSLICLLNYNVSSLPSSLQYVIQGYIALKRSACLMDQDEVHTSDYHLLPSFGGPAVVVENGNFSWTEPEKPFLKNINLSIAPGKLVAVVGGVGSGKSSFLSCLLREMKTETAKITISDSVAYLPQQAWILNGTVRDNICFQKPFNDTRFFKVVEACALGPDLDILPGREMTEVGARGANLSGGQKQRVSLARGVYSNCDTYLIDDSLSAVDPNVGQHIFKQVFGPRGLLRKKTRVFATNSFGFLPEVDRILVLKDGRIVEDGTYEELRRSGKEFCTLISQPLQPEKRKSLSAPGSVDKSYSRRTSAAEVLSEAWSQMRSHDPDLSNVALTSSFSAELSDFSLSSNFLTADEGLDEYAKSQMETHKIVVSEDFGTGFIKRSVISAYIKSGGCVLFFLVILGHCLFIATQAVGNWWLKHWTDLNATDYHNLSYKPFYLEVYGIIGAIQLLAIMLNFMIMAFAFLRASRNLHFGALYRMFRAPISFFDTNPPGRILNYFSTDMDTVDALLPLDIILWLISVSFLLGAIITIGIASPIYLAVVIPILFMNVFFQRVYGANAIPLKRFYAIKKSPVYSHFEESIVGAASIRAFRQQQYFIDKCDKLTDESHRPWCSYLACWRLSTSYNEFVGALAVFLTAVVAVAINEHDHLTPGQIGLALFSIFQVLPYVTVVSRMAVEIEANIVAVERIKQYSGDPVVPKEADWEKPESEPSPAWPDKGVVEFQDFSTRYRPGLDMVLANLSFKTKPEEKIGIVGRTGAGKSSIILSLFRMIEAADGVVVIDGVDISELGLHDLRSKLTTIPQDPILFSGTLRSNLDPLNKNSDEHIWKALEQAHLKDFVETNMDNGLDQFVSSGDEISVGQRQLLCMARALLRNSKIIVLDEATSGIDPLTDELIQATIRTEFTRCTVITIAHRISTIMDYDRVMVLDHGNMMELGPPHQLIRQNNSIFASMARETCKTFGDEMPTNKKTSEIIISTTDSADDL